MILNRVENSFIYNAIQNIKIEQYFKKKLSKPTVLITIF